MAKKKEHGASVGGAAIDVTMKNSDKSPADLADVPATVPELPNAYLVRDEDLSQLKAALLADSGGSGTALTSKKRQNKVGPLGMVRMLLCLVLKCFDLYTHGNAHVYSFVWLGRRREDDNRSGAGARRGHSIVFREDRLGVSGAGTGHSGATGVHTRAIDGAEHPGSV